MAMDAQTLIAGVDEAGRGPWAGPVSAAAVILSPTTEIKGLRDSKKISEKNRERLFLEIQEKSLAWAIGFAEVEEIDQFNILQATFLAMQRAVMGLKLPPDRVYVDGNSAPSFHYPTSCFIGGDDLHPCISAASILAKVARDRRMIELSRQHPEFGFSQHKGYGTKQHLEALNRFGPLPCHRKSFAPIKKYLRY